MTGKQVYMKVENEQKTGAFKVRGAMNKIFRLGEAAANGVMAASAGNHAQGVALAAAKLGVPAKIYMPEKTPLAKVEATKHYGASVVLTGESYQEAYEAAIAEKRRCGGTFIHPFDDPEVIAGQGTIGLEMLQQQPDLDTIVVPVGGGGLISGIAVAVKSMRPDIRVVGVQAEKACVTYNHFHSRGAKTLSSVKSIADGIAVKKCGTMTYPIIKELVDDVVVVSEEEIAGAITFMLERNKSLLEGAGAAGLASVLFQTGQISGEKIGVVVSGGNMDLAKIPMIRELADNRLAPSRQIV